MNNILKQINDALQSTESTVATAESCTGGLIGATLSSRSGSSLTFVGGAITYANEAKIEVLRVPEELLRQCGAVSREVAITMAESARTLFDSTYALSATGIAGPTGGSAEKPVGTVWCGMAGPRGTNTMLLNLRGDRDAIRQLTVESILRAFYSRLAGRAFEVG